MWCLSPVLIWLKCSLYRPERYSMKCFPFPRANLLCVSCKHRIMCHVVNNELEYTFISDIISVKRVLFFSNWNRTSENMRDYIYIVHRQQLQHFGYKHNTSIQKKRAEYKRAKKFVEKMPLKIFLSAAASVMWNWDFQNNKNLF